jgi:hypothetical protein
MLQSNISSSPTIKILEFFIFHRTGTCLLHLDLQEDQLIVTNKALNVANDREAENRYKLIFGLIFSMKSFVKNLSPNKTFDFFKSFLTSNYKLHYVEFLNGLRFVCITSPIKMDLSQYLKEIYSSYYVNLISKNILINKEDQIKNEIFLELVYNYLNNLNQVIN